jgi:AcrR family transcriptional regulator
VARATIYRNWPDPVDLVEIMLARATESAAPAVGGSTGDVDADLHSAMDTVVCRFQQRTARAFFAACIEYGRRSDRVASVARSFVASILEPIHSVIGQAIDAGRLVGEVDELVVELAGPVVMENVLLGQAVDAERGRRVVEHFLAHHRPQAARRRNPGGSRARPRASVDA